jgi:ATP-dependent RNA helicase RhlE
MTTEIENGFQSLGLRDALLRALAEKNYTTPSPIQEAAIPPLLRGSDLWGCAQTGTGKTAAFALPILQLLADEHQRSLVRQPRALILTPTRELALQVRDSFAAYGSALPLRVMAVFGGVGLPGQVKALSGRTDILVATPGRLLDLCKRRAVDLRDIRILVLDEADRMLDMGFAPDVKRILAMLPKRRQSLLFSATMPPEIRALADSLLVDPVRVEITPQATTVKRIEQGVCHVDRAGKHDLLLHLLNEHAPSPALIFTRTKHGADGVARRLVKAGRATAVIHGNKTQAARQRALEDFRNNRVGVLVATDIAARGIDVKGIGLVVNYEVPVEPESYVHRIGRTARAGTEGVALTLCSHDERNLLRGIQKLIRMDIPVRDHPFASTVRHEEPRRDHARPVRAKCPARPARPNRDTPRQNPEGRRSRRRFRP